MARNFNNSTDRISLGGLSRILKEKFFINRNLFIFIATNRYNKTIKLHANA